MIKSEDKIIKNNDKYLILNKNNKHILKISQRAGDNLEQEFKIIKQLRLKSVEYNKVMPQTTINEKKISSLGKFFYIQEYIKGHTLSNTLNKRLNKLEFQRIDKIKNKIYNISRENLNSNSRELPSSLFVKLIMNEFETMKKKEHLSFLNENKEILIDKSRYKSLGYLLTKTLESKKMNIVDNYKNYFSFLGHFNFHGENIILKNLKKNSEFFIIDPDSRWQCLDPMFAFARFFYTFDHDTIEYKNYLIKSNFFDLSSKKINSFEINYNWKKRIFINYQKTFNRKVFFRNKKEFLKMRFNLNFLLCLLRGINSNYEEKIDFPTKRIGNFRHSSIYLALISIKFLSEINTNE